MPSDQAPVLVILPDTELPAYTADRVAKLIYRYFPKTGFTHIFVAPKSYAEVHSRSDSFGSVIDFDPLMLPSYNTIVVSERIARGIRFPENARVYILRHNHSRVLLRLRRGEIDCHDYPAANAHPFNQMGPRLDTLCFFPYGFLFRECGMAGPLDAFGFRLDEDLDALRQRPPEHKLIAVVGGSAAWGWFNFHEETFSEKLEDLLQQTQDGQENHERVTVLNFSQGMSVLLHEMIVWMLYVERLHPEIVISHDGCNDMLFGMTNDPFLLDRAICAPHVFELWARKLHDRDDIQPRLTAGSLLPVINRPSPIVSAYIERKRQFDRMVRSSGAVHIAALQPILHSKTNSELELESIKNMRYGHVWRNAFERLPHAYDLLSDELAKQRDLVTIDLHKYFERYDASETLFQDYMHTTPCGDIHIAEAYCDLIRQRGLLWNPS